MKLAVGLLNQFLLLSSLTKQLAEIRDVSLEGKMPLFGWVGNGTIRPISGLCLDSEETVLCHFVPQFDEVSTYFLKCSRLYRNDSMFSRFGRVKVRTDVKV